MGSRDSAVSAARWLVGVSALVVVTFVAATATSLGVQSAITSRATDIITNAMPSVKFLSQARGDLHRIDRAVESADENSSERTDLEAQALSAREDLDEALATYLSLPFFPQERQVFKHVSEALDALDSHFAAWRAAPSRATLVRLRSDITQVDAALERSITFDADQGQRLGLEIEEIRGTSIGLVVLVGAIAVLFAIGVVLLAVRQLQRAARARGLEEATREQREAALRAANEALGQFAGRVAHDVRSPLAATMLSLDLVRQTRSCKDDAVALKAVDRGTKALHRVQVLVDGLLEFARAGGKPEASANVELTPALRGLCEELSEEAERQNIALTLAPVPAGFVACSRGVLTSIVSNLVRNALKYMGEAGERRIDLRVIDAGARWRLDVSDTGPGIPEDQQQRIFEPYVRAAKGGAGIGLGLATVARLARAHGGTVAVRSTVGAGSTFSVELPKFLKIGHPADVSGTQPPAD